MTEEDLLYLTLLHFILFVCVCMRAPKHTCAYLSPCIAHNYNAPRGQRRALQPLELAVVSRGVVIWVASVLTHCFLKQCLLGTLNPTVFTSSSVSSPFLLFLYLTPSPSSNLSVFLNKALCYPGTSYVDQTTIDIIEKHLSQPLSAEIKGLCHHTWLGSYLVPI